MKKVLFVLALGAFAACGTSENKETTTDSPAVTTTTPVDTSSTTPVDTTHATDTTHH